MQGKFYFLSFLLRWLFWLAQATCSYWRNGIDEEWNVQNLIACMQRRDEIPTRNSYTRHLTNAIQDLPSSQMIEAKTRAKWRVEQPCFEENLLSKKGYYSVFPRTYFIPLPITIVQRLGVCSFLAIIKIDQLKNDCRITQCFAVINGCINNWLVDCIFLCIYEKSTYSKV